MRFHHPFTAASPGSGERCQRPLEGVPVSAHHDQPFTVNLMLRRDYEMAADFGQLGMPPLVMDEPVPLGNGRGPNAVRVLAAAVGNCLGSSLLFCLRKARVEVLDLRVAVHGTIGRNEEGRLRVTELAVRIDPVVPPEQHDRVARCRELFEDFCIVSRSVAQGIAITTTVRPAAPAVEVSAAAHS
jgi:uncharacterized OsmC-like protein